MNILEFNQQKTLADLYSLYLEHLRTTYPEVTAKQYIAKLQTAWIRYVLPGWGFPLKLEGNLTPSEVNAGLQFMHTIQLFQVEDALAIQAQVYQQFGDRISASVQRVYRSALQKSLEWGQQQSFWQNAFGNRSQNRAVAMQPPRGRCKSQYRLQRAHRTAVLHQEIEQLYVYWQQIRLPKLSNSSIDRYLKDVENVLGWLHHIQGVSLDDLRLTTVVPKAALQDPHVAQQVAAVAEEYIKWLRTERVAKQSTQMFAFSAFVHITEYLYYVESQSCLPADTTSDTSDAGAQRLEEATKSHLPYQDHEAQAVRTLWPSIRPNLLDIASTAG